MALLPSAARADLPVRDALPAVLEALRRRGAAVLVAPPGSGKTSLLPLALADAVPGRVVVAEPRRIATRAAARRMAWLIDEPVGGRIGYAIRGESRTSAVTRVEVVTTGLLVARMQRDPELPGVDAIVLDEIHERSLDSDLALAFALDVQASLRPELQLLATSATPDTERLAAVLNGAPVIVADARSYPVDVVWAPPDRPIPLLPDARVDPQLLAHVAAVIDRARAETEGDVLVFLPGEAEIRAVARRLGGDVVELYGRQSAAEQDRALQPGARPRVVLSTAVSESSLTVPGVRVVVDAGLSREPRIDHARGLSALVTTKVSRAAAEQRAGRAGREAPGRVYRCWSQSEHAYLAVHPAPEIATADLTSFALAAAGWGHPRGAGLALLDAPPAAAMDAAEATLTALQAVDDDGRVTAKGRAMATVGAHPRLARALLDGAPAVGSARASEVVALLSIEAPRGDDDLVAVWRRSRSDQAWREEVRRLTRSTPTVAGGAMSDDQAAGLVVGLAFPERLARARSPDAREYLMAGGTGASLDPASSLRGAPWLAIAVADRPAGRRDARISLAVAVDEVTALQAGAGLRVEEDQVAWVDGDVVARRVDRLGAIVRTERPLRNPSGVADAVRAGLAVEGLGLLTWSASALSLRARLALCHDVLGEPWPAVDDATLRSVLDLSAVRRRADLARLDVVAALRRMLPWPAATRFDELVPERIRDRRVQYEIGQSPILAIRIQQAFGWTATPTVLDGRVPVVLHLLSPAGRPAAVTADLPSFWRQGYPQVRSELRGRYPKHAWPQDPFSAGST